MSDNPFNIVGNKVDDEHASLAGNEIPTGFDEENTAERIKKIINAAPLVVFMKGNAFFPQCGFSKNTTMIFTHLQVPYRTYDILRDPELRQEIKEFSNWPTFPQVYLNGKLLGGNDIIVELFETGELKELVKDLANQ